MSGQLRASFAERDQYLDLLSRAYAEGRLDEAELTRRRDLLFESVTHQEIERCFEGLPTPRVTFSQDVAKPPVQIRPPARLPHPTRVDRRGLLAVVAGVGLIAVVGAGVGLADITAGQQAQQAQRSEEAMAPGEASVWLDANQATEPVLTDLRSQGLTSLVGLTVTQGADGTKVFGKAHAAGSPDQVSEFERINDVTVIREAKKTEPTASFPIAAVAWDQLGEMTIRGEQVFGPDPKSYVFAPDQRGGATVTLTYDVGKIVFSGDGQRVLDIVK